MYKTHRIRTIARVDPRPIEQEAYRLRSLALTLAKGVHELAEGGGAFDFEEDFVVVVGHFDVEVFGAGSLGWVACSAAGRGGGRVGVGHFGRGFWSVDG